MAGNEERAPDWDAKQIARIASESYGGFAGMVGKHYWPEGGSEMMRAVQKRVAETYGVVDAFVKRHAT